MQGLRRLDPSSRFPLVLALLLALAVRLLVPSGFMPVVTAGGVTIVPCSGMGPSIGTGPTMIASPHHMGEDRHHPASQDTSGKSESPCAFAGLGMPAMGGADPVQIAAALTFVLALAFIAAVASTSRLPTHLRPPLRGPPLRG